MRANPHTPHLAVRSSGRFTADVEVVECKNLANYVNSDSVGCAIPTNLNKTALIDMAVLYTLFTLQALAKATAKPHGSITVIQPGGDCMTITHAINLLLHNLPPEAQLGHHLPGLVNNLLSVATLVNAGCKVFFHCPLHRLEVTFDGTVILRGWRDPKNKLWRIKIVDDGWTTNCHMPIPDSNPKPPTIALVTPPTAWANSLYECLTTHILMHFYYECLNFPVVLTLILALNTGYLKGFPGLTANRVRRHINVSIESKHGHMDQVRQGIRSTKPATTASLIVLPAN
jgi:hypothetical protein